MFHLKLNKISPQKELRGAGSYQLINVLLHANIHHVAELNPTNMTRLFMWYILNLAKSEK